MAGPKQSRSSAAAGWLLFAGVVAFVGLAGPSVLERIDPGLARTITEAFTSSARREGLDLDTIRHAFTVAMVVMVVMAASMAGWVGWRVWRFAHRRRASARRVARDALAAGLRRLMPEGWDPDEVRVRAWVGARPRVVTTPLSFQSRLGSAEWRVGVTRVLRQSMGALEPVTWPPPGARRPTLTVTARRGDGGGEHTPASREELLVEALAGLMPAPHPSVADNGSITVGYGQTTRDQSGQWRARVVDQVSARTGSRYRAQWDRQARSVTLTPVPALPAVIRWDDAYRVYQDDGVSRRRWMAPYGTDENGYIVGWEPGDAAPHSTFVGETGSGKTEAMKSTIAGLLRLGALVVILDPKRRDFAEFLGRPGVIAVATSIEDRVGALVDLYAEMKRRTAAMALRRLEEQYPELAVGERPVQSVIDAVPLIVVIDELTQHTQDVQKWWARLPDEDKIGWFGTKARNCPVLGYPGEIVQLARAVRLHVMVGLQRPDAANFGGDSTAMRDSLAHRVSMGQLSAIGSEMQWGDRSTGSDVVIEGVGEGMSNGDRMDSVAAVVGRRAPGRFKAWHLDKTAEQDDFWARVAEVAPDAGLIDLPNVSAAARDPRAAAQALRKLAYGDTGADPQPLEPAGPSVPAADDPAAVDPAKSDGPTRPAPRPVPATLPASSAEEQRVADRVAAAVLPGKADDPREHDGEGRVWAPIPVQSLQVGSLVSVGEIEAAELVDLPGMVEDEFDGAEVFRVILLDQGEETTVDLSPDEMIFQCEVSAEHDSAGINN